MAKSLWITEYGRIQGAMNGGPAQIAAEPKVTQQLITVSSAAATASAAFNANTRMVRLASDGLVHLRFSTAGTAATSTSMPMFGQSPEYFGVNHALKVSVIST